MNSEIQFPSINKVGLSQPDSSGKRVVVCRGRSCLKYQAEQVFCNFQQNLPPDHQLISVPCLGQCGNGTMVVVESDQTWYSEVHPDEVEIIIKQHLIGKSPVKAMLYDKFHQ